MHHNSVQKASFESHLKCQANVSWHSIIDTLEIQYRVEYRDLIHSKRDLILKGLFLQNTLTWNIYDFSYLSHVSRNQFISWDKNNRSFVVKHQLFYKGTCNVLINFKHNRVLSTVWCTFWFRLKVLNSSFTSHAIL